MHKLIKAGSYGCHSLPGKTIRKNEMISDEDFAKIPEVDKNLFCSVLDNLKASIPTGGDNPPEGPEGSNSEGNDSDDSNATDPDPDKVTPDPAPDPVPDPSNEGMKPDEKITPTNLPDPDKGKRRGPK